MLTETLPNTSPVALATFDKVTRYGRRLLHQCRLEASAVLIMLHN